MAANRAGVITDPWIQVSDISDMLNTGVSAQIACIVRVVAAKSMAVPKFVLGILFG
jgi:hypothetical protein